MRTSQQLDCFFLEGEYLKRFFILMLVVSDVWIFFYDALFKRAAIFITPLNLMDIFFSWFQGGKFEWCLLFFKEGTVYFRN